MAKFEQLHEWSLTPREAVELQKKLRERVRIEPLRKKVETVAGADISFNKFDPTIYTGIVVLRLPSLEVVEEVGIACHVGLIIKRPTLGCAKSVLVGRYEEPGEERGSWSPLVDKGETVGAALRTKTRVQPIYVSPGHLINVEDAVELTLRCDGGYRQPEPTRRAHLLVNALRRGERSPTSESEGVDAGGGAEGQGSLF